MGNEKASFLKTGQARRRREKHRKGREVGRCDLLLEEKGRGGGLRAS